MVSFLVIRMSDRTHWVRSPGNSMRKHGSGMQCRWFWPAVKTNAEATRSRRSRRSIPVRVSNWSIVFGYHKKPSIRMVSFLGDSYVGPNPLGSITRQFHAQAWQRYVISQPSDNTKIQTSLWCLDFSLLRTPLRSERPRDGRKNIKNWNPNDEVRRILSHSAWNSCGFQGNVINLRP